MLSRSGCKKLNTPRLKALKEFKEDIQDKIHIKKARSGMTRFRRDMMASRF